MERHPRGVSQARLESATSFLFNDAIRVVEVRQTLAPIDMRVRSRSVIRMREAVKDPETTGTSLKVVTLPPLAGLLQRKSVLDFDASLITVRRKVVKRQLVLKCELSRPQLRSRNSDRVILYRRKIDYLFQNESLRERGVGRTKD